MTLLDPFFIEALVNGILLGGVFALPVLGLNLVFGVVDVVWLCYAELVMVGMYVVWFLYNQAGWPLWAAFAVCLPCVAILGVLLHLLVVRPLLTAPPINQVLATGGVLFVLQGGATLLFSTEFRSLGTDLPPIEVWEIFVSGTKLSAFIAALVGAAVLWLFLKFTYVGTAIRAIAASADRVERVVTDTGDIVADAYVMALGSYAPIEARKLGVALPVYPVKGYAMTLSVAGRNGAPLLSGVDEQNLVAWSRLGDRLRLTATAEFAGYDTSHKPADFAHMLKVARGLFPDAADFDRPSM